MKNVRFQPWVGKNYNTGINGKRVMVLGESHYCANESEAVASITNNVILDLLNPDSEHEHYKNTYTKFERAVAGKPLSFNEKADVWNSLVFYNFVQFPISSPRVPPTREQFANSEEAFFEVLEQYRPDCLLVWGERMYNNLPNKGYKSDDFTLPDGTINETWEYPLSDGHVVRVLRITHPSAAFTPEFWHKAIHSFLQRF